MTAARGGCCARAAMLSWLTTALLVGCSAPTPTVDAAVLPDAAVSPDAATDTGSDANVTTCGTFGTGAIPPLPVTCVPLCTAATGVAFRACTDVDCLSRVLTADPTPSVFVDYGGTPLEIACAPMGTNWTCISWQQVSCEAEACPASFYVWQNCVRAGGTCDTERNALLSCAQADADFLPCYRERADACFAE